MTFETPDIATAAFLQMRGFVILEAKNISGKYKFVFKDPDSLAMQACLEFINSECAVFDSYLRLLRGQLRDSKK